MTAFAAFLRGVNLGKRTVRSADLKQAFEGMSFINVRTLLASGNVLFEASEEPGLAARIETGLQQAFGFAIGTVLRRHADLEKLVASDPFKSVAKDADAKLYVALLREPLGKTLNLPFGAPGDFDVLAVDDYHLYAVAWRKPDGRYGADGLLELAKQFPKKTLITMRNWNTIVKAAA